MTSKIYFIIIRGPLGCGKSTIAKELSERLKAIYISVDEILEKNKLDNVDKKRGCIPVGNFIKANQLILSMIRESLDNEKVLVFDACFYHKEPLEDLISKLAYKNFVFTLKAPLGVCIERDKKRKKPYGEAAVTEVYRLVSRFDYGNIIDVSKPINNLTSPLRHG